MRLDDTGNTDFKSAASAIPPSRHLVWAKPPRHSCEGRPASAQAGESRAFSSKCRPRAAGLTVGLGMAKLPVPANAPVVASEVCNLTAVGDALKHKLTQSGVEGMLLPQRRGREHHPLLHVFGCQG